MSHWRELLAQRESAEHFVVEGQLAVERLLASHYEVIKVLRIGPEFTRAEASEILGYQFHRGCLAIAKKPAPADLGQFQTGPIVALPEIADPGNLGTIIRNTAALGGSGVILGRGTSPYNAKAIRASAGTLFQLPIRQSQDLLSDLQTLSRSHTIIGTDLGPQAVPLSELPSPKQELVLVFGPEDFGINDQIRSLCHHLTYLPMTRKTDSLNVACSSAIFLHALNNTFY